MEKRPDHYSSEQRELIKVLAGTARGTVTEEQKNELLLQFMRTTDASRIAKNTLTEATRPRTHASSFEEQEFGIPLLPGDIVIA